MHLLARWSRLVLASSLLGPVIALGVVWLPVIAHYRVPSGRISDLAVEAARRSPGDAVLREVRSFSLYPIPGRRPELEIAVAEAMLRGQLELPGGGSGTFSLEFAPGDLEGVPAGLRLWLASFAVPDFLLAAYAETGREEFFTAARDYILDWGAYERRAWLPKGLLWNDHATAARVRVLGEFWRLYRTRPDFDPRIGARVLQQAARYGSVLSDPAQFTFATNHGVMQNLGLLHLALVFPTLPESDRFRRLAGGRLDAQMVFYMDQDGIIRENSAGYQSFGLDLLAMTFRAMTLLGDSVPPAWRDRYHRGLGFLGQLRRPDGTLPATGDTDGAPLAGFPRMVELDSAGRAGPLQGWPEGQPGAEAVFFPAAGYWVEWDGLSGWPDSSALRQTMATWTNPPPPAHKHADDMAVWLWSDGISWLTASGYWPYDVPGRDDAVAWPGSNAPHTRGESRESPRFTRMVASGTTDLFTVVELERSGPGDYVARRMVLTLRPDAWVIADRVRSSDTTDNMTVWTVSPVAHLEPADRAGSFIATVPPSDVTLQLGFLGSSGTHLRAFHGSRAPLAGWQVVGGLPQPAPALVAEQPPGDAWLFSVLLRADSAQDFTGIDIEAGPQRPGDDTEWSLHASYAGNRIQVSRSGASVRVSRAWPGGQATDSVALVPGPSTTARDSAVRLAFAEMAHRYPRFQDSIVRRTKVMWVIVFLLAVQEGVVFFARRRSATLACALRCAAVVAWVGIAVWLHMVFVPSWTLVPSHVALLLPITMGARVRRTVCGARLRSVGAAADPGELATTGAADGTQPGARLNSDHGET